MGNKLSLDLTKEEQTFYTIIKDYINQATNYKALYKPESNSPVKKTLTLESLASDNIEYSKINAISRELSMLLTKKNKANKEK
jgi:hypothetical protein